MLYWRLLFTSFITGAKELLTVMYDLYCMFACVCYCTVRCLSNTMCFGLMVFHVSELIKENRELTTISQSRDYSPDYRALPTACAESVIICDCFQFIA